MTKKKHDVKDDVELTGVSIEDDTSSDHGSVETTHKEANTEAYEGLKPARAFWFKRLLATKNAKSSQVLLVFWLRLEFCILCR